MPEPESARKVTLLERLDRWPVLHRAVRAVRVRELVRAVLARFPVRRTLEGSGVVYRIRNLEGFLLADEIFKRGIYDSAIQRREVNTFIDLGCNVGLFECRLAHMTRRTDLEGLAVDANKETLDEASWHISQNGLKNVKTILGMAGAVSSESGTADFYVYPSDMGSSQFPVLAPETESKGDWRKVRVPTLNVERLWREHFGVKRVDLMKIDIEGSEESFVKQETNFLENVDRVVLELHEWLVDRDAVDRSMASAGFAPPELLVQEDQTQILYYERPS
jgi:FkbM family methyltransferase